MALKDFTQRQVTTRLGSVGLLVGPQTPAARRPLLLAIPGILAPVDPIAGHGVALGMLAEACILQLPVSRANAVASCALADLSAMVGEILETEFAARQVVLLGVSTGAVIALGVRARNLARVVAVEPPLVTRTLWPLTRSLPEHLRSQNDPVANAFALEALGLGPQGASPRDHTGLLRDLSVPVDVLLGSEPLMPPRELKRLPSLVDEAERRRLAATPGVRLHVAPDAGHNVLAHAPRLAAAVLGEACRRAAAILTPERLRLDEPLLEATPLTAQRILYRGADGAAFAEACRRRNPACEVEIAGGADGATSRTADVDVLVLGETPPPEALAQLAPRLRPQGTLVVRWTDLETTPQAALPPLGFALREPVDEGGTGVWRTRKPAAGAAPAPALKVRTVAYATVMMDIRTRLPTQALQTDPELRVTYERPPFTFPPGPREAPKILLLQRPAELRPEVWRDFIAEMIRDGWLVVMEFDDDPLLVAEVQGRPVVEEEVARMGYVHAIQTASPPLLDLFRRYNPETVLFPNAAFDLPPFPQGPRPPKVFYGAALRGGYAVAVARALAPAAEACPDVEFVVIGDREVFDALPGPRKRYYDYMSYEAYLELMADCAVSLSPIEALPRREAKSDAKFIDAARAGVLTIASPTIYDRVIRHGENGLLAREIEDWAPLLVQALTNAAGRERMARQAWEEVRDGRMFAHQAQARRDWYRDLWRRREALNEALMARMPGLRERVAALTPAGR
ncbi:glycosyltransferase [Phenylobacterium sp.]|uniref:glycosyltransferase family protein n=1 Tax=Phenylobacterium sp. TaxID=1871053 RepID=UPI0011F9A015|nr:glycosyltransferase [Phenylobacterium sp.]THD60187.1 MAG: hypothetical protein E8A49_14555 [Phenylobacterium sp.]